jgi:predicted DNA-binding antitoxin AbrB/MazE fold protein
LFRAIYQNGVIYPAEPVPPELFDGQEVRVDWGFDEPSDDPDEIDRWDAEWRQVGPFRYEPGEKELVQAALQEADALAKLIILTVDRDFEAIPDVEVKNWISP